MSKHRWRESLHCLCENHIDPEKEEQLKQSKIEIQNKVTKALKLVHDRRGHNRKNRNGEGNSKRDSELSQLIEDFSRQYQFIYDLYADLRTELSQTYIDITEDGFYTASSDSASETSEDYYHPNGSINTLESQDQEFEDLSEKFTILSQEKESLKSNHMESLSKVEELEKIVRQLEDESKQLKEKLGDKEGELSELAGAHEARNKEALALIKDLEAKVESLNHENGRLKGQTEHGSKAIQKMQIKESDLEDLVLSLKKSMQDKDDELSNMRPRVKGLESELNVLEGKLRELEEQLLNKDVENSSLNKEVDSLLGKVKEFEKGADKDKCAQIEINQLNSNKEVLQGRILELEKQIEERGDRTSDMTIQMEALAREVNMLQQELDVKRNDEIKKLLEEKEALEGKLLELEITITHKEDEAAKLNRKFLLAENEASTRIGLLNTEMNSIQQQMSSERDKSLEKVSLLEKQNNELTSKVSDQRMILKQQEETINSLRGDFKLAKSKLLQAADRKIEEMAVEFRKSFEANIMILRQRIRVAEQVQTENKESFKCMKERCEQEHIGLEEKVKEYSEMIAKSKREISKFFETINQMLDGGLQSLFDRFEDKEGEFLSRISRVLDEITVMKNWVKVTANEMNPVKDECGINKGKEDKARLMRGMYELQKKVAELEKGVVEKEEEVMKIGEEKKEAIRQLCISVEYHQNRCDQLLKLLSKISGRC